MSISGARPTGILYTGVEDSEAPSPMLTRSELNQLNITGAPVYVEHDYRMNPVGSIYDSWIDDKCRVWIATELYGEDKLGASLSNSLNKAVRGGKLRDFSIGLDAIRVRGSGKIEQKWLEASLVNEGKYAGTHITIRGSEMAPDSINPDSVVTKYLGTRDRKNTYLEVYPKMSAMESSPAKVEVNVAEMQGLSDAEIAARHVELARKVADGNVQIELKNVEASQVSKEMQELRAALAQSEAQKAEFQSANSKYKAEEDKRIEVYRESQKQNVERYIEQAKSSGVSEEESRALAENLISTPNGLWKTMVDTMDKNDQLVREHLEMEEKHKKFRDEQAVVQAEHSQAVEIRASKRARTDTTTVEKMFEPAKDEVPVHPQAVHFPISLATQNPALWNDLFAGSARNPSGLGVHDERSREIAKRIVARNEANDELSVE